MNISQDPIIEPSLPNRIQGVIHRPLEVYDIEIIFRDAGPWWLFYALLLYTGIRCNKLALLTYHHVDRERGVLVISRNHRRVHQIPLVPDLLKEIPADMPPDTPLFPTLYTDIEERSIFKEELNAKLAVPLKYLQGLLSAADRPTASLFSFTVTHRSLLDDDHLFDRDQLAFLAFMVRVMLRIRRPAILN